MAVAADRQSHEDQEYSSPPVHCKCNDPGTFVFVSVLILAIIQDQALVASKRSKHYLIETKEKSPGQEQVVGLFKIHISLIYNNLRRVVTMTPRECAPAPTSVLSGPLAQLCMAKTSKRESGHSGTTLLKFLE